MYTRHHMLLHSSRDLAAAGGAKGASKQKIAVLHIARSLHRSGYKNQTSASKLMLQPVLKQPSVLAGRRPPYY